MGITLVCLNVYVLVHAMYLLVQALAIWGNHNGVSALAVTAVLLFVKNIVNYM